MLSMLLQWPAAVGPKPGWTTKRPALCAGYASLAMALGVFRLGLRVLLGRPAATAGAATPTSTTSPERKKAPVSLSVPAPPATGEGPTALAAWQMVCLASGADCIRPCASVPRGLRLDGYGQPLLPVMPSISSDSGSMRSFIMPPLLPPCCCRGAR